MATNAEERESRAQAYTTGQATTSRGDRPPKWWRTPSSPVASSRPPAKTAALTGGVWVPSTGTTDDRRPTTEGGCLPTKEGYRGLPLPGVSPHLPLFLFLPSLWEGPEWGFPYDRS